MVSNGSLESTYRPEFKKSHMADLLNVQLSLASQNSILISQRDLAKTELLKLKDEVIALSNLLVEEGKLEPQNRAILTRNLESLIYMKFSEKANKQVQTSVSAQTLSIEAKDFQVQIENYHQEIFQLKSTHKFEMKRLSDEISTANELIKRKNQQIITLEYNQERTTNSDDTRTELAKMILEKEDLLDQIHKGKTEKRRVEIDCEELRSKVDFLQDQIHRIQLSKDSETQTRRNAEIELSTIKSDLSRVYQDLNEARAGRDLRLEFSSTVEDPAIRNQEPRATGDIKKIEDLMDEIRLSTSQLERKTNMLEMSNREPANNMMTSPKPEKRGSLDARASFISGQMDRARLEIEYQSSKIKDLEDSLEQKSKRLENKSTELDSLKIDLDKKVSEVQSLLKKIEKDKQEYLSETERLRSDLDLLHKEYADHKKIIAELNKELDKYDTDITELEKRVFELSTLYEASKSDYDNSQAKAKQLRFDVIAKEAEIEKWKLEARRAAADSATSADASNAELLANLKEKFALEIKRAMDDNESLREKVRARQFRINEMELELEQLAREKETVASLRQQLDRITIGVKPSQQNSPRKKSEDLEMREKINSLTIRIQNLTQELEFEKARSDINLREALSAAEDAHRRRISEINNEKAEEALQFKQQIDLLKKQIRELEEPISTQQMSLREKQQQITELSLQLNIANTKAAEEMKNQEDEIQRLRSKLREFSLKNDIGKPVSPLKEQEAYSDFINQIEDLRAKLSQVEIDLEKNKLNLKEREREISDLKVKNEHLRNHQLQSSDIEDASLQTFKDKIAELRDRIRKLESEKMEIEDSHSRKLAQIEADKDQLDLELKQYVKTQREYAFKIAQLEKEIVKLTKENKESANLKIESQSFKDKLDAAEARTNEIEAKLAESNRQHTEDSDLVAKLSRQLELSTEKNSLIEKNIKELKTSWEEEELDNLQKLKIAQRSLEAEKQDVQLLREQISSIKRLNGEEIEDLNARISAVSKKLNDANKAMAGLETQIMSEKRLRSEAQFEIETLERKVAVITRDQEENQSFSLASERDQLNFVSKEMDIMKKDSQILREEKDELTRKLVKKQEEIYELETMLEQAKKRSQSADQTLSHDFDSAQAEITKLKRLVQHKETEIEDLVEELNKRARNPKSTVSENFDEIISLKSRIKELEEELQEAKLKASVPPRAEIERFQEHIEDLTQTNNQLLQKLKDKQNQMLKAIQEKDEEIEQIQVNYQEKNSRII